MPPERLDAAHLPALLNAAPVAMLVSDGQSRIVFANQRAGETFGYPVERLLTMTLDDLMPARMRSGHPARVQQFFAQANPRVMGVGREVWGLDAQGREMPLEIGLTPLQTPQGPLAIAAVVDITERKRREADFTLARLVQSAMLPDCAPSLPGVEIAALSEPADAAGGDFYDFLPFGNGRLAVAIGDASGHGFSAALVTVAARSYLRAYSYVSHEVPDILRRVNALLLEDRLDGRFVTLFYALLDPGQRRLSFSGAGHAAYVFSGDGTLKEQLASTGPPLGWFPDADYPCREITLESGDILLMLTDGIEEALSPEGEAFGRQRLLEFVRTNASAAADRFVRHLHKTVHAFQGTAGQHDDATVMLTRFTFS